jgi:hypothetical protein
VSHFSRADEYLTLKDYVALKIGGIGKGLVGRGDHSPKEDKMDSKINSANENN